MKFFCLRNSILLAVLSFFVLSCTGSDPWEATWAESLDNWMKKNNPDVEKIEPGFYRKIFVNPALTPADTAKAVDSTYVEFLATGTDLGGNYFMNFYPQKARQLGSFSNYTNYVPFRFQIKKWSSYPIVSISLASTLTKMNRGDSAVIYTTPINTYGLEPDFTMYLGLGGSFSVTKPFLTRMTIKLVDIIPDPEKKASAATTRYAVDVMQKNPVDTIKKGLYFKMLKSVSEGTKIGKVDTTLRIDYSGYFLNGFLFDTSIDSVARKHHIYNSDKKYAPLEYEYKTSRTDFGSLIKAFKYVVEQMKPGERAIFVTIPEWGYGADGKYSENSTLIMVYEPLIFELEIKKE